MKADANNNNEIFEKILTVVVPAYNVEKYIRKCLDSLLLAEVLSDLEVLIIDDGGTDHTLEIAETYVKRAPDTFKVITKENGGHGSVINCGIQEATGKYFKVVDGDDWVDKRNFKKLISILKHTNTDIVASNYCWVFEKTGEKRNEIKRPFMNVKYEQVYSFPKICHLLYIKMHSMTIRTDILKMQHIQLDEHCFYVDTEYITYPIPYVNTILFLKESIYMYRIGLADQSVNIQNMQKNIENHLRVIRSLMVFYENVYGTGIYTSADPRQIYIVNMINRAIASQFKIYLSFKPSSRIREELRAFDLDIKRRNITLYKAQKKPTVCLLRKSNFRLYWPIACVANWRLL